MVRAASETALPTPHDRQDGAHHSPPCRRDRRGGRVAALLAALALVGCGGRTQEYLEAEGPGGTTSGSAGAEVGSSPSDGGGAGGTTEPPPPACVPALGEKLVAHACSHTSNGPFLSVVAGGELTAPDVSELHRTYEVQLVGAGARLRYRAQREGGHAFMTSVPVVLEVGRAGSPLARSPSFPVAGCSHVTSASVFELERGAEYEVTLRESPVELQLFIEHLGAFGAKAWAEPCEASGEG
jgi:hypothetical protein